MFVPKSTFKTFGCVQCLRLSFATYSKRTLSHANILLNNKTDIRQPISDSDRNELTKLAEIYDEKLLYNSIIEKYRIKRGYKENCEYMKKRLQYEEKLREKFRSIEPLPITLKYYEENLKDPSEEIKITSSLASFQMTNEDQKTHFPYGSSLANNIESHKLEANVEGSQLTVDKEIQKRYEMLKGMKNWMTDYENYEHDLTNEDDGNVEEYHVNYGTPDPNSKISNTPCGGCGALLHCKDTAIPGYIPSEIFHNCHRKGAADLSAMICQRCYFLKEYNMALQVRVTPDDYIKVLKTLQNKRALVVLMVDLLDFPCSIWPGISDILCSTPMVIVGNKVDLLPKDDEEYLRRIKKTLYHYVRLHGFGSANIKHIGLISAKTGFGVEPLITNLFNLWSQKGDIYLVGCTNVGKSSLFNSLLQSDFCKVQASDLIQRATTSLWPGTTLNLLKFPITRPSGHRLFLRGQRLHMVKEIMAEEKKLLQNSTDLPNMISHLGRTFEKTIKVNEGDAFATKGQANATGRSTMGIKENDPEYALSRWCFDTPGVVQTDQILDLLTTDELVHTLPKQQISPRTFCVKPGTTLFIAGLARLDYLEGPHSVRLTVFCSDSLPITICQQSEANLTYSNLLGTELFKVPMGGKDRLEKWPGLEPTNIFTITSKDEKTSCNDVVLSSAGWVAVNCKPNYEFKFQAWTPQKRGVHLRDCLLPKAVALRGARVRDSVAYRAHRSV